MSRKKLIVPAIVTIVVAFTTFMFYFIAINRAESTLAQLVKVQSDGKLIFNVKKVNFNILDRRFVFIQPELRTKDSSTTITGYHIKARNISFKAKSFIPFLFGENIIVDSVLVHNPEIEVFKYNEKIKKKISLPKEMRNVYQSLEKVLNILKLNYLHINEGRFKIYDRSSTTTNKPVEVSRLNLTINKVNPDKKSGKEQFLFADRILLEVFNQDILWSDGRHGVRFKRFSLNTKNQSIKLDSCYLYSNKADSTDGMFRSFVDTLRISNLDLSQLVNNNILKMDSALCINPEVTFQIPLNKKRRSKMAFRTDFINKDSLDFVLKKILGNLDIGYLTIRNAKVKIVTKKGTESKVYNSSNSNFSIEKLLVNSDPKIPIHVGRFNLDVRNYVAYSPDSLYVVRFDEVQILNKKISLLNLRIGPTALNQELLSREIEMEAFEFNNINWGVLLYESRIVAGNVIMVKPNLYFKLSGVKKNTDLALKQNPFNVLEEIRGRIQIKEILIKDGSIRIEDLKETSFSINHVNARLNVNQLLKSTNVFGLIDSPDTLTFENGEYRNPSIQLLIKEGSFTKRNNSLRLSQIIQKNTDQSIMATMNNVYLNGISIHSANTYSVASLSWAKADLTINIGKRKKENNASKDSLSNYKFMIGQLSGGPTLLNLHGNIIDASTQVNHIATNEIILENDQKPKVTDLVIDGQSLVLNQNQLKGIVSDFRIQNQHISVLNNITIKLPANNELINVFVPKLIFSADLFESINGEFTADYIELQKPIISFTPIVVGLKNTINSQGGGTPRVNIRRLTIDQPELMNLPGNLASKMQFDPGKSSWNLLGLHADSRLIKADSIRLTLIQPNYRNDKISMIPTGKESVSVTGSDFIFNQSGRDNKSSWSVKMNTLKSSGLHLNISQADTVRRTIVINSLNFENLDFNNQNVSALKELFLKNDHYRISNGNIVIQNNKTNLKTFNLALDKSSNSLIMDSLSISQIVNKEVFMNTRQSRGDYMQFHTGLIKSNDIDINRLIKDAILNIKKITINDLYFYDYKDKRLPFLHGVEKPLLTDLLNRIQTKILIDSLILRTGGIVYEEFNDKTQQYGNVKLNEIRGVVSNIKNYGFMPSDSIHFNLFARLMDATNLRAGYAQSYTDSLSGFNLKLIASSFDFRKLNPFLKPFATSLIKSGYLDTLRMSVIGQKYVAYGIMKMHYHNLIVQYLNKGDEKNPTMKSGLISFFANGVINNKNTDGSGEVYAERDPEKSFINYWVKILIGGLLTNTGIKTDNKQEKKYYQSIKKYNVPLIQDIPIDF